MIDGKTENMEEWNTIISETVNKYTKLKDDLIALLKDKDQETQNKYKSTLNSYNDILKMYSHYKQEFVN